MTSEKNDFIEIACPAECRSGIMRFHSDQKMNVREIMKKVCRTKCLDALEQGTMAVGIYGKLVHLSYVPGAGDRMEIYRPLITDALGSRQRRLNKQK